MRPATCSTVQYSAVHYSTVQFSTVYYSTVQYSTNPSEDAALDQRGRGAALGGAGGRVVPAQHVLDTLRGEDQQDCNEGECKA